MGDFDNNTSNNNESLDTTQNSVSNHDTNQETSFQESNLESNNNQEDTTYNSFSDTNANQYSNTTSQPNSFEIPSEPMNKKPNSKKVALIIVLAVLLAGSVLAFAKRNAIINTLSLMTKNPADYYAYVEQKAFEKGIDKLTAAYDTSITRYNEQLTSGIAQDSNIKLTIDPQFTTMLGLGNFESIEAKISALAKGEKTKSSIGLLYNSQSIISMDTLLNTETSDMYMLVPELSSAYLMFSLDEVMDLSGAYPEGFSYKTYFDTLKSLAENDSLSPETLNSLLDKYSAIIIKNMDTVTMAKNVEVKASDIKANYTKLSVTITEEDAYNIASDILNTAKNDKEIIDICTSLKIYTKEEYTAAVDDAITELESSKETISADNSLIMNVYVDASGNIMGREFTSPATEEKTSIGYYLTHNGTKIGYTLWASEGDNNILDISGTATTKTGKTFTGKAVINFSEYNYEYDENQTYTFHVEYKDFGITDNKGHMKGNVTLTSDTLAGASLSLDCSATEKEQKMILKVIYGNLDAATIDLTTTEGTYQDFEFPSETAETYDAINDMSAYIETVDYDSFISDLESKLQISDLQSFINEFISGFLYGYSN